VSYEDNLNVIHKWFIYTDPATGVKTTHAESVRFNNHYETVSAYKRLLERLNEPVSEGYEWGISCPQAEVDLDEEIAPVAERLQWVKELRRVRFGQA
jgi:hypothetical protein